MSKHAREGDLYKTLTVFGHTFHLYYGYYDEIDRSSLYGEPIPIYPDFRSSPCYTEDGRPFVTEMQDACRHFDGAEQGEECHACRHYEAGEDLIGICVCDRNRESTPQKGHIQ